jgi:hypothetical protein
MWEEAEYFTNQVYREYKRTSAINYELARSLTINIGEMLLRLTYTVSNGWQDLLKRYTGLNEERKAQDEKQLLAHANMKAEDFDFEENAEDLPMFKELAERNNNENLIVESSANTVGGGVRYTVAYKKMEGQGLLEEPLINKEEANAHEDKEEKKIN